MAWILFLITSCASTPHGKLSKKKLTVEEIGLTESHYKECDQFLKLVESQFAYNKMGLKIQSTNGTMKMATAKDIERYAENGENGDLISGYYLARCLRTKIDLPTPNFETMKPNFSECSGNKRDTTSCVLKETLFLRY